MHAAALARTGLGALRRKLGGGRRPLNVMVSVTNRCNSLCGYCDIPDREGEEPSTGALLGLVDQLAYAGTTRLGLWGGEPLMRADLGTVIARARKRGLWVSVDTNGYLFKRRLDAMREADHVVFSLDGEQAAHDANREPGSWSKTTRAMRLAAEEGIGFWTLTVLTGNNLDQVVPILDRVEALGGKCAFQVLHHPPSLDGDKGSAMMPSDAEYRAVLESLIALKRQGRGVANSGTVLRYLADWPDYEVPVMNEVRGQPCLAGDAFCNVDTDGTLQPCSLLVGSRPGPNVYELGFDAAWSALVPPVCRACSATAFAEYSRIYDLHPRTVASWVRQLH
jgi:MoaA/NifB/PqqE/SkfB family radical SAM enzyme